MYSTTSAICIPLTFPCMDISLQFHQFWIMLHYIWFVSSWSQSVAPQAPWGWNIALERVVNGKWLQNWHYLHYLNFWDIIGQKWVKFALLSRSILFREYALFWTLLVEKIHNFSNLRHHCCNFGRHYLSNFQITGLGLQSFAVMTIWYQKAFWGLMLLKTTIYHICYV